MTLRLNRARTATKAEDPNKEEGQEANEEEEQTPQPPASKKAKKAKAQEPEKEEGQEANEEGDGTEKPEEGTTGKGARAAERGRLKAILNAEGADGFSNLAMHLATETALSASTCAGIIAAAMEDVSADDAPAPRTSDRSKEFRAAMANNAPNPKIGSGAGRGRHAEEDEIQKTMREMGLHKDCK